MGYTRFVQSTPTQHETIRQAAKATDRFLSAENLGVSAAAMARMESAGVLQRLAPGVYLGVAHRQHGLAEAAAWTVRYPRAVVCLLTAAIHHGLTDAFGRGTWLFVPKGTSVPRSRSGGLQVVQVVPRLVDPGHDHENGIMVVHVHGMDLRVTDPDRTVLDLWRYPLRVASEHGLEALHRRVSATDFDLPRFARLGRRLGSWNRIQDLVQGMIIR